MAQRTDGRVERGNQTRRAILDRTVQIASIEGLGGLSLGRVATECAVSKSGVFALFGSMEELQLATVRAAVDIFVAHVIAPARGTPPGVGRLWRVCENWLAYSKDRVFDGGCFFFAVAAEFDARGGPVRDLVAAADRDWVRFVEGSIAAGVAAGSIDAGTDVPQLAYELIALVEYANLRSLLHGDDAAYDRAAQAVAARLRAVAVDPAAVPDRPVR